MKPRRMSNITIALWCIVAAVGMYSLPFLPFAAWELWKSNPDEVRADCKAVEVELKQFKAGHGRYPKTLEEAGINPKRAHSEIRGYKQEDTVRGDTCQLEVVGNYYGYHYYEPDWDPLWGGGG